MQKILTALVITFYVFLILAKPLFVNLKTLLLISQEFPQIPIKPLHWVSSEPVSEQVELSGGVLTDLKKPKRNGKHPAIILTMGVRTNEQDKPVILGFADTMARLGYVAVWPHSLALDEDKIGFEEPETFVKVFNYLKGKEDVDARRISFVGFSVGSSLAMVAAQDASIAMDVHSLIFFGGYYNILDYLAALAGATSWEPHEGAITHAEKVLDFERLELGQFKYQAMDQTMKERILRFSPDKKIENFNSRLFILHDRGDQYVPWAESEKLRNAVCNRVLCTYHLSGLLEHAQVSKQQFTPGLLKEFWELYLFLYQVLGFL